MGGHPSPKDSRFGATSASVAGQHAVASGCKIYLLGEDTLCQIGLNLQKVELAASFVALEGKLGTTENLLM